MRERQVGIGGSKSRAARLLLAGWAAVLGVAALPQAAHAQFFFWDRPHFSADDAARSVIDQGFRPLARPVQNGDVYTADVVDRRGRRERLIVSGDNGQILQRFVMQDDRGFRRYADPTIPRGPVPPGRIPNEDSQPNVFSRLFSGDRNEPAAAPTGVNPDAVPVEAEPKVRRRPRVVERTPEPARPSSRIDSAPLAPPTASAPSTPEPSAAPAPSVLAPAATQAPAAATPAPARQADVPPADRPVRNVLTNPLSIPGTREQDEKTPRSSPATAAASAAPAPARPAAPKLPAAAPSPDVPVAPLD